MNELVTISDIEITTDSAGRFSLNALHRASEERENLNKSPSQWLRTQTAKDLQQELEKQTMQFCIVTLEGRNGGTFAHKLLAISYAGWISPSFQLQVNQEFLDSKEQTTQRRVVTAAHILEDHLKAGTLLGAPLHLVQIEAVKSTRNLTGCDYSNYLRLSPAQDDIPKEDRMLEPLDLGKRFGVSGIAINRLLKDHGYQSKEEIGWVPTELGKSYCTAHSWKKGSKSGYNLKWRLDLVEMLLTHREEAAV